MDDQHDDTHHNRRDDSSSDQRNSPDPNQGRGSVVVTGAGGGLGRAIALRLASDGFRVGLIDRGESALQCTAAELEATGNPGYAIGLDLRDADAIEDAVAEVETVLGGLTGYVNNAAIYPARPFLDVPLEEYRDVVDVNQVAYFAGAQAAAARMVPRRRGAIVNVGSITFHGGWDDLASYVSTKGAALGLTRALARELGPHGVRVNAVSPGAFPTAAEELNGDPEAFSRVVIGRQSIKRRGTPEELAAVVSFLLGDDSSFVTGQTINVDGGWVMQ